jgi:hypothetical protein
LAPPSDLAPLTALTRLAVTCVPPELASLPLAARLRRLELRTFRGLEDAPGGGGAGGGSAGTAAAALAALARGAPLLERLSVIEVPEGDEDHIYGIDHTARAALGAPLGAGVCWPSLAHLQATPGAAGCTFPRLSRLVARADFRCRDVPTEQLQAALAALAAKARDHVALRVCSAEDVGFDLAAAAAVPGVHHLSWRCLRRSYDASAYAGVWARLPPSLESLELV